MMKIKNKKYKGFTLIELLAVIVVTSMLLLVAGTVVVDLIKKGKEGATKITWSSIKEIAIDYTTEQNNITWLEEKDDEDNPTGNEYTCTTIQRLINKGYLNNNLINAETNEKIETDQFIKITRDEFKVSTSNVKADGDSLEECDSKKIPFKLNVIGNTIDYDDKTWYYDSDNTIVTMLINKDDIGISNLKEKYFKIVGIDGEIAPDSETVIIEDGKEKIKVTINLSSKIPEDKKKDFGKNIQICGVTVNGNDVINETCMKINADFTTPTEPNVEVCESKNINCNVFEEGKWYKRESVIKLSGGGSSPSGVYYSVVDSDNNEQKVLKSDPYTKKMNSSGLYNISTKNNVGKESTKKEIDLRIDNVNPTINLVPIDTNWSTSKKIDVTFEDNESGLAAYQISGSETPSNSWNEITGDKTSYRYESTETQNKTIYIHVKDKVGNLSTQKVVITKIDTIPPICTNSGDSTDWTKSNRIIYYGCSDNDSGCDDNYNGGYKEYNATIKTDKIASYIIRDNAGNETICQERDASVYVDTTKPSCTNSGDNLTWVNNKITINYGCSDSDSGCNVSYSGGSKEFNYTVKTAKMVKYTIKDNAGNETLCDEREANVYVDKTVPTCKVENENTIWTNSNVTITYGCSDNDSGCVTSDQSKTFKTTGKTDTLNLYTIKDKAGNETTCEEREVNVYIDKVSPVCKSFGDSTTWTNVDRIIKSDCDDEHSGCNQDYVVEHLFSTTTKTANISEYTIYDNAGNSKYCYSRTANVYVDKDKPSCTNSGDNTSWTSVDRTIYWGCSDIGSGCNADYSGSSKKFDYTVRTAKIAEYIIKDKAGNETTCEERDADVFVDKTKPSCTDSGDSTTWTSGDRTIYWGCSDDDSGCSTSLYYKGGSKPFTTSTKTSLISSYTIKDNAGNQTQCDARTANVYVDKDKPNAPNLNINFSSDGYRIISNGATDNYTSSSEISYYLSLNSTNSKGSAVKPFSKTERTNGLTVTTYAIDGAGNVSNTVVKNLVIKDTQTKTPSSKTVYYCAKNGETYDDWNDARQNCYEFIQGTFTTRYYCDEDRVYSSSYNCSVTKTEEGGRNVQYRCGENGKLFEIDANSTRYQCSTYPGSEWVSGYCETGYDEKSCSYLGLSTYEDSEYIYFDCWNECKVTVALDEKYYCSEDGELYDNPSDCQSKSWGYPQSKTKYYCSLNDYESYDYDDVSNNCSNICPSGTTYNSTLSICYSFN